MIFVLFLIFKISFSNAQDNTSRMKAFLNLPKAKKAEKINKISYTINSRIKSGEDLSIVAKDFFFWIKLYLLNDLDKEHESAMEAQFYVMTLGMGHSFLPFHRRFQTDVEFWDKVDVEKRAILSILIPHIAPRIDKHKYPECKEDVNGKTISDYIQNRSYSIFCLPSQKDEIEALNEQMSYPIFRETFLKNMTNNELISLYIVLDHIPSSTQTWAVGNKLTDRIVAQNKQF